MTETPMPTKFGINSIAGQEYRTVLSDTMADISDVLQHHCGPASRFCMFVHPSDSSRVTKDGINIIQRLAPSNQFQQAIARDIAFIGDSVERVVGDGTTTAMIAASRFGKLFTDALASQDSSFRNYHTILAAWDRMVAELNERMNATTVTVDRLVDIGVNRIAAEFEIARRQAMCSSHGDVELANHVAELFSSLPAEAWPYITFRSEVQETGARIRIEYSDENAYALPGTAVVRATCGKVGGNFATTRKAIVVVHPAPILAGSPEAEGLRTMLPAMLEKYPDEEELLLITRQPTDDESRRAMVDLSRLANGKLTIFYVVTDHYETAEEEMLSLITVAGLPLPRNFATTIDLGPRTIKFKGNTMTITDLYTNPQSKMAHPALEDPASSLSERVKLLQKNIDSLEEYERSRRGDAREVAARLRAYRIVMLKTRYTYVPQLVVGGSVHDNAETIDVLVDCIKAARSSLLHGLQPGMNVAVLCATHDMSVAASENSDAVAAANDVKSTNVRIANALANFISRAFTKVLEDIVFYADPEIRKEVLRLFDFEKKSDVAEQRRQRPFINIDFEQGTIEHLSLTDLVKQPNNFPPVQPANLIPAILTRIREVIFRLCLTERMVLSQSL